MGDGREDVDDLYRGRDSGARQMRLGELDDQRHLHRLTVQEDAVLVLAVLSKTLSVV